MIARALVDIDADDAVGEALGHFRWFIRQSAGWLAQGNRDLADELEQEAGITLWRTDPTRFDGEDEGYLQGALFKRMQQVVRNEERQAGKGRRVELGEADQELMA